MKLDHPRIRTAGLNLMEVMVVVAVLVVIGAITYPIVIRMRAKANQAHTLKLMQNLGSAIATFAAQNDGGLPMEDLDGKDDWGEAMQENAAKVWYNALPQAMQSKGVGDFAKEGRHAAFYTKESVLFVPGANYPDKRKLSKPFFAMAMNSRLQRGGTQLKLSQVAHPNRTVIFFEQGLPGETRAHETMSKKDYDGAPKGSAKSFVARYNGKGIIAFLDGTARPVSAKELLQPNGEIIWSENAPNDHSMILWSADPKDDPNGKLLHPSGSSPDKKPAKDKGEE